MKYRWNPVLRRWEYLDDDFGGVSPTEYMWRPSYFNEMLLTKREVLADLKRDRHPIPSYYDTWMEPVEE